MHPMFFNRLVPARLYGGHTASAALLDIDRQLRRSNNTGSLARNIETGKLRLLGDLRSRFPLDEAKALAVKLINICLAAHCFRSRLASLPSRPFGLIVDPSNSCRLACPGCVHSERSRSLNLFDWSDGTLSADRYKSLLKRFGPYAVGVYFCNYGEPLLNLHTPDLIRAAKRYLAWTALSTSLSVQRFDADAYVESGLDFMIVSIDGATQSVYERFRRHGNLALVFENLRSLIDSKRRLRKKTPVVSWNFLAFEHNAHEIPAAAAMARKLGVDQFRVAKPFNISWDDPGLHAADSASVCIRRLKLFSTSHPAGNWNPFPHALESDAIAEAFETPLWIEGCAEATSQSGQTCQWLYKNMVMDATGRILPCCAAPRPDADLVFASIDREVDPFNSEMYVRARSFSATGVLPPGNTPYCAQCSWDHTAVEIGGAEVRRYFRAASPRFFDRRSLRLLSEW